MELTEMLRAKLHEALDPLMAPVAARKSRGSSMASKDEGYVSITKYLRGASSGNWYAAKAEHDLFEEAQETAEKQMGEDVGMMGGFLVHPRILNEVIPLLRAKAIVRQLGIKSIDLEETNALAIPRKTASTTGYWVGEGAAKTPSDIHLGELTLKLKEYICLVQISNALMEDSTPAADVLVKEDMAETLALGEDLALIQGVGGTQPLGIYNWPGIAATTLLAAVTFDNLVDMQTTIESANGHYSAWLCHPRSKGTLRKLKDAEARYIWAQGDVVKGQADTLMGMPVRYSTQIPTNLTFGALTNCSYLLLGGWDDYTLIQKRSQLELATSTEAGSSFEHNQTWFRAVRRVDAGPRQVGNYCILNGIR